MLAATKVRPISADQYTALLQPVKPPTPEELFEFQRATLHDKKLAPLEMFDHFASCLPQHGLFLLVPPQPRSPDYNELMARVELDGKKGQNYLDQQYLKDLIEVPNVPTMLTGIEDGHGRRDIKPSVSSEQIPKDGRTAYYTWRGYIHVALFPMVLKHHYLDMVGSRSQSDGVPYFYLFGGRPTLGDGWRDGAGPRYGAPSCGRVER